jgi:hypothetical protein
MSIECSRTVKCEVSCSASSAAVKSCARALTAFACSMMSLIESCASSVPLRISFVVRVRAGVLAIRRATSRAFSYLGIEVDDALEMAEQTEV